MISNADLLLPCTGSASIGSSLEVLIYYQNVRGLRTKLTDLFNAVLTCSYPIIILTETWLTDAFYNSEIFDSRYIICRADRNSDSCSKNRGGGVLIGVLGWLSSCQLISDCHGEELWVKVNIGKGSLILCAIYIPPASPVGVYLDHFSRVEKFMADHVESKLCLVGDYNLPDIAWLGNPGCNGLSPSHASSSAHQEICDFLCYLNLLQYNQIFNHRNSILDLVLSNITHVSVIKTDPLSKIDDYHPALEINIPNVKFLSLDCRPRDVHDFQRAPYYQINYHLSLTDWSFLDVDNLDLSVHCLYRYLQDVIDHFVPIIRISHSTFPVWVKKSTRVLISKKK